MPYLILASCLWAFSFGLIKQTLTGVDPFIVSALRLFLSFLLFLPFLGKQKIASGLKLRLLATGAVQYGLMYSAYLSSFQYIEGYEVAIFTVFTPFYVAFADGLMSHRSNKVSFATAALAVAGCLLITWRSLSNSDLWAGCILVQISNGCFAAGQIAYRNLMGRNPALRDNNVFGWLYLGGMLTAAATSLLRPPASFSLDYSQMISILYLGLIPSGLGFFLWNLGSRKVHAGTLAILNDLKIPLGVAFAVFLFGEKADPLKLTAGTAILLLGLWAHERLVCGRGPGRIRS